tara:strand:- start:2332 stop:2961 length:630 start_codon:yes stop_codon:yes gene_type:complete
MRVFLIRLGAGLMLLLGGCQLFSPLAPASALLLPPLVEGDTVQARSDVESRVDLQDWLNQVDRLMVYTGEQAQAELKLFSKDRSESPGLLFYYALLNQQRSELQGWIRARDSLQRLAESPKLSPPVLALVRLLQFHNQSMINADARQTRLLEAQQADAKRLIRLSAELQLNQQQVIELTAKIEALTTLEESMSIRRALTTETPRDGSND